MNVDDISRRFYRLLWLCGGIADERERREALELVHNVERDFRRAGVELSDPATLEKRDADRVVDAMLDPLARPCPKCGHSLRMHDRGMDGRQPIALCPDASAPLTTAADPPKTEPARPRAPTPSKGLFS